MQNLIHSSDITEYAACKAGSLVQEKGILVLPDNKKGKHLKIKLIWLKYSMKMLNFLNKWLENKIM